MKISGIVIPFTNLIGERIDEIEMASTPSSPVVVLRSDSKEFIVAGIRTCCNVLSLDQVVGDIDKFTASGPITSASVSDDGVVKLVTDSADLEIHWRISRAVKKVSDYVKLRERRRR